MPFIQEGSIHLFLINKVLVKIDSVESDLKD